MAEYINRDALRKKLKETAKQYTALKKLETAQDYWWATTVIDSEPAADVAPVVYCRECRYFGRELENGKHDCTDFNLPYCRPDDFCSHGEQKEATSTDE